jgi:DNA (cytosine-5)-methyltransferase 1
MTHPSPLKSKTDSPNTNIIPKHGAGETNGKLRVLDLFSGFGAYSLGLERTGGFETVAFCEIREYPRHILRKHWPDVPIYEDVRALTGAILRDAGIVPQWIIAGWPCQDVSVAGSGIGLDGERSGLWSEIARLASELGVEGLILENSSNLLAINDGADFGRVLADLAALWYDAEWHCLSAAAFDAPHIRDRVWIVATLADNEFCESGQRSVSAMQRGRHARRTSDAPQGQGRRQPDVGAAISDFDLPRMARLRGALGIPSQVAVADRAFAAADAHSFAPIGTAIARQERHIWEPEPDVVRVVHGVADRVERIHGLGNLNPPIVPETIGRALLQGRGG